MGNNILITGAAGFIGYHLCKKLLGKDLNIIGFDNFNSYYDPSLKKARVNQLNKIANSSKSSFKIIETNIKYTIIVRSRNYT